MANLETIKVVDSWSITSVEIIAELKHNLNGLESGSIIKSQLRDLEWKIEKRILFYHVIEKQKKFPNEITTYIHSVFESAEKQIASTKDILEKEEENIFQYRLQALGHSSKPQKGEILIPVVTKRFPCPCCGYKTFQHEPNGTYDICPVCFWEDDQIQFNDPDYEGGANPMSLKSAQENFLEFGACDRKMLSNVRKPFANEQIDESWKPLGRV